MLSAIAAWLRLSDVCVRARSSTGSSWRSATTPFAERPALLWSALYPPGHVDPLIRATVGGTMLYHGIVKLTGLPLAAFALWAIARRNVQALIVLGALAGVVQLLDAGVGLVQHDLGKMIGPLVIAVLQAFATLRLAGRAGGSRE